MGWLALAGVSFVGALFLLAAWLRRGEHRADRAGQRTCVTFCAPRGSAPAPGEPPGIELARALGAALANIGTEVGAPSLGDGHGWAMATTDAYFELFAPDDGTWSIMILDPSSGGPGPIATAQAIDRALRTMQAVERVRWHARESFDPFDDAGGADHPTG